MLNPCDLMWYTCILDHGMSVALPHALSKSTLIESNDLPYALMPKMEIQKLFIGETICCYWTGTYKYMSRPHGNIFNIIYLANVAISNNIMCPESWSFVHESLSSESWHSLCISQGK